jgi:hypothetical protein
VISFVLLNWNGRGFLRRCVESVQAQTNGDWELIAVDNGSTNGSLDYLAALERVGVLRRLVRLPKNRGYAVGMNVGISAATGDVIVPLNNDVYLARNFVESIQRAPRSDHTGMWALPVYRWRWAEREDELTDQLYTVGVSLVRRLSVSAWHPGIDSVDVLFAPEGSAPVFSRAALLEAQRFAGHTYDERYRDYGGEDIDLFIRLRALGFGCLAVLETAIWHVGSASYQGPGFEDKPLEVQSIVVRNRLLNYAKLSGWTKLLTTLPWVIAEDLARVITLRRRDLLREILLRYGGFVREHVESYPRFTIPFAGGIHSRSGHTRRKLGGLPSLGLPHPSRGVLLGEQA